ncbi:hypothetical protein RND71_042633 [Anisodus tanguticus]|uniref:Long-chain-alcohol oxidase n=1 Tax=Anisodus tanguticus TaxID=243964 RepID=A0AAE1QRT7_9SOLA|nr:hypothetical protein RND71_042633 [Anisodus tanguticus]
MSVEKTFISNNVVRILKPSVKILTPHRVNEKSQNLSWKALDYCGPDPDFKKQKQENMNGSGGGVIAGILANAGHKVLVLEKGSYLARTNLSLLEGRSMDQMYLGSGLLATKDMDVMLLAGSTVGEKGVKNWGTQWKQSLGTRPRIITVDGVAWVAKMGRKKGTGETWLVDLVKSENGAILPECEALEVIYEKKNDNSGKNKAIGVTLAFQNSEGVREICMVKSKVTVIACGALSTPSLLKVSGLNNPNIGKNLHLHPVVIAWGYFPDSPSISNETWPREEKKNYKGGIMTAMSKVVANFEGSSGYDIKMRMSKYSRTAYIFVLERDKESGEAFSPYSVTYKLDQTDEENLKLGLEKTLRILAAAGAEEIGTQHGKGKSLKVKEASLKQFERFVQKESSIEIGKHSAPICSAHQMGSCRMGVDPRTSVVNPKGETWEAEGLFLGDSSVFPTALGVNPMVTVQAISYCTAQSVLQVLKNQKLG